MYNTAIKLLKMINEKGFVSYIVGGYPRDLYLDRPSADVDICTSATPKDLKEIFGDIMLPDVQYGSVTVVLNNIRFEITTFRKEIKYENNRLPVEIKYIDNLLEDLKRRDFTINTLCIDSNGTMLDLMNGKEDINNKVIKMVGNPRLRLKEDSFRILRAIRFATILNFKLDNELKKYIKKYGYLLSKLSYYRKKEELDKIFSSINVSYGIDLIKDLGLDKYLELSNINSLIITTSSIGIWAQLNTLEVYNFTNNEREMIIKINELMKLNILDIDVLYKYGLYLTSLVGEIKGIDRKLITATYNSLPITSRAKIAATAMDICMVLDKEPGPYLKQILDVIEYKVLHSELDNNKDDILKYIKVTYKGKL